MFGYITVDKETISARDLSLFNAFYCGLCVSIKKEFGNIARLCTNIDCTFAYSLLVSYLKNPVDIEKKPCLLHPFSKRPILKSDDCISSAIAHATVLICYYKLIDDILDRKSIAKSISRKFLHKAYLKARKAMPNFDCALKENTLALLKLEKEKTIEVELMASYSGNILVEMCRACLKEQSGKDIEKLFFDLGAYIYLLDAVDDLDGDYRAKQFNVLIEAYGNYQTRESFIENNKEQIVGLLERYRKNIVDSYEALKPKNSNSIIDNVIYNALAKQQDAVLYNPKNKLFGM